MRKIASIVFILYCLLYKNVFGQPEDNIWVFGTNVAVGFSTGDLEFLSGYLIDNMEGSISISDSDGNILFYSDGSVVRNRWHDIMPNGSELGAEYGYSSTQCGTVCRVPGSETQYYLFTVDGAESDIPYLRYSIVDMSLDGGNGDVVSELKNIPIDPMLCEKIAITVDSNCNYWLLTYNYLSQEYRAYHITEYGISPAVVTPSPNGLGAVGEMKFSFDGNKIANAFFPNPYIELGNFDKSTGTIINIMKIDLPTTLGAHTYGLDFSKSGNKLYCQTSVGLYQFDVSDMSSETVIEASANMVASYMQIGPVRLANNGKIYIPNPLENAINVVHEPEESGVACNAEIAAYPVPAGASVHYGIGTPSKIFQQYITIGNTYDSFTCYQDSVVLECPMLAPYIIWDDGSTSPQRVVYESGTYWVSYGAICSRTVDTFHVLMVDSSIGLYTNDTTICLGDCIYLIAEDKEDYEFLWSPSDYIAEPNQAVTTFSAIELGVHVINLTVQPFTCPAFTKQITITVNGLPEVYLEDTVICAGKTILYGPTVEDLDDEFTFLWSPSIGVDDINAKIASFSPEVSTMYYISVNSGADGCTAVDSFYLTVIPQNLDLANNDTTLCEGLP